MGAIKKNFVGRMSCALCNAKLYLVKPKKPACCLRAVIQHHRNGEACCSRKRHHHSHRIYLWWDGQRVREGIIKPRKSQSTREGLRSAATTNYATQKQRTKFGERAFSTSRSK